MSIDAQIETCTLEIISQSAQQTQELARQLGALLQGGDLLLLDGRMGAGKTTFTQGLARGMQISRNVSSPTFTILKEYKEHQEYQALPGSGSEAPGVGLALYHFDLYRLDEPDEILDLGFEEYFYGTGVCVVEWAEKAATLWPAERLDIRLEALSEALKEDQRRLLFRATGTHYCELIRQFQKKTYATASS